MTTSSWQHSYSTTKCIEKIDENNQSSEVTFQNALARNEHYVNILKIEAKVHKHSFFSEEFSNSMSLQPWCYFK